MDESFSPTIFLYGMALILAVGKAFTLTIWRTLPKPRPGLRQEIDSAGLEEPQASEAGRNERSSVSSQRAHGGRSLEDR